MSKSRARHLPDVLLWGSAASLVAALLLIHWVPSPGGYTFVFLGSSLVYLILAWTVFRVELSPRLVLFLLCVAVAVRASFLATTPVGSDDVFRYIWDGKVQAAGIDPYRYAPNDPALTSLHSTTLPSLVNHPDMRTLYFPLTQWVFFVAYSLSGEALWGIKLMLLLAETLTVVALAMISVRHAGSSRYTLLYALCPLPILQFAVDAHIDALGVALLAWGLLWYLDGKKRWSYLLIGLSMSVKPVALVLLPLLFLNERGVRNRVAAVLVPLLVVGLQFVPYLFSAGLFDALFTFTRHWVFNGALFETVNAFVVDNQRTRALCAIVLTASLSLLYLSRLSFTDKVSHSLLLLFLCSPVVHPWYVAWLAVVLPLVRTRSAVLLAATVSLTSFTILTYKETGVWQQYPLAMLLEYIPVVGLLAWELLANRHLAATSS